MSNYITERLDSQINWYDKKSKSNKKLHYIAKTIEIILASAVPFLVGLSSDEYSFLKIIAGSFSVLVVIIVGISNIFKFQEHWSSYRTTSESLKHEKYLYINKVGPYSTERSDEIIVENIEKIISNENSLWVTKINTNKKKS